MIVEVFSNPGDSMVCISLFQLPFHAMFAPLFWCMANQNLDLVFQALQTSQPVGPTLPSLCPPQLLLPLYQSDLYTSFFPELVLLVFSMCIWTPFKNFALGNHPHLFLNRLNDLQMPLHTSVFLGFCDSMIQMPVGTYPALSSILSYKLFRFRTEILSLTPFFSVCLVIPTLGSLFLLLSSSALERSCVDLPILWAEEIECSCHLLSWYFCLVTSWFSRGNHSFLCLFSVWFAFTVHHCQGGIYMNVKCFSSCHRGSEEKFCVESLEMLFMEWNLCSVPWEEKGVLFSPIISCETCFSVGEKRQFYSQFVSNVLVRCLCDIV